jgi:hypothetical protein
MITWKSKQKFFQGDELRPTTLNEKLAIAFLAGATAFITVERIVWYFQHNLRLWF